jgi:hypothetical protein
MKALALVRAEPRYDVGDYRLDLYRACGFGRAPARTSTHLIEDELTAVDFLSNETGVRAAFERGRRRRENALELARGNRDRRQRRR